MLFAMPRASALTSFVNTITVVFFSGTRTNA